MKKLDEILAGKKSVGLAGHVRPDGDCVGSTLGVYNYIRKYYPDVDVRLYLEPIPNIFKFLNFSSEIRSDYEESVVLRRFTDFARLLRINPSAERRPAIVSCCDFSSPSTLI